jgi:hypothetical protein
MPPEETLSVSTCFEFFRLEFLRSVRQDSRQFFHDVIHFGNSSDAVDQLFQRMVCMLCM